MNTHRIPEFVDHSFDGMLSWFSEMSVRDLLFHPDDAPGTIVYITTDKATFTAGECLELERILASMFRRFGDGVYEAAYPVFMKRMGSRLDS